MFPVLPGYITHYTEEDFATKLQRKSFEEDVFKTNKRSLAWRNILKKKYSWIWNSSCPYKRFLHLNNNKNKFFIYVFCLIIMWLYGHLGLIYFLSKIEDLVAFLHKFNTIYIKFMKIKLFLFIDMMINATVWCLNHTIYWPSSYLETSYNKTIIHKWEKNNIQFDKLCNISYTGRLSVRLRRC